MLTLGLLLALAVVPPQQFEIDGQILSAARLPIDWIEIESVDERYVSYGEPDGDGKFVFKRVPEGLYRLIVCAAGGREERRSVEVRPTFADSRGRVSMNIELSNGGLPADRFKIGAGALGVSPKAEAEMRKALAAHGDDSKVREHLEKAIAISPNFDRALNNLGALYCRARDYETAKSFFERALDANPNSFAAQANLGAVELRIGDYEDALAADMKALKMRAGDSLVLSLAGQALFNMKRYDEALPYLETAKRTDPISFTFPGLFIGQIQAIRGESAKAIAEYTEFLNAHPGNIYTDFVQRQIAHLQNP